jgi:hypothetical protein
METVPLREAEQMPVLRGFIVVLALSVQQVPQAAPGTAPRPSIIDAKNVLLRLQAAIRQGDNRAIAAVILFPLGVLNGKLAPTYVPSVPVFMRTQAGVFTNRVRKAILAQDPASLTLTRGQVSIGGGVAVIGMRCEQDKTSCNTGVILVRLINDPPVR